MRGRCVLITGASRGIGLAISRLLSDAGYDLALIASSEESIKDLRSVRFATASRITVHQVDVANRAAVSQFAASPIGPLWGIVNNAGICKTLPLDVVGHDPIDEVLATNLLGPYFLVKALLPKLQRPGRIVNIASQLGVEGRRGYAAYCASKFGLIGITKCWAKELGPEGITVNAICPGWVDTEMSRIDMERLAKEKGVEREAFYRDICAPLELRRFNSSDEVAQLTRFLLSDDASGITGRDWLMQTVWNQE